MYIVKSKLMYLLLGGNKYNKGDRIVVKVAKNNNFLATVTMNRNDSVYFRYDYGEGDSLPAHSKKILGLSKSKRVVKKPISDSDLSKYLEVKLSPVKIEKPTPIIKPKIAHDSKRHRWAISDIHGCNRTFKKLLSEIGNYEHLYLLGDYIDRGPDSAGVLDTIMSLPRTTALMGNHELMLLDAIKGSPEYLDDFLYNGGKNTLKSFGVSDIHDIPSKYISWISRLKPILKLEDYILVHGGLDFKAKDPFSMSTQNISEMLWNRGEDYHTKKALGKRIIVGHDPKDLKFIKQSAHGKRVFIDGGCVYSSRGLNHLVAFNMDTNDLIFQKNIESK